MNPAPQWPDSPVEKQVPAPSLGPIGARLSFAIYLAGVAIVILGLVFGAILLNMPGPWIAVCALVLLGLSVLGGVTHRLVFRARPS